MPLSHLLGDGHCFKKENGRLKTFTTRIHHGDFRISIFSLQESAHPAMAHHAPTLCWQSPENQSVMLPNSTIESVITVGSSNTPNSTFVSTCSNNFGLSFFAEAFFGLDLAVASVEPRCVSRCVIGEMMPQTAAEVLKKKQRVRKLKKKCRGANFNTCLVGFKRGIVPLLQSE